jgi:hypothetical protein
MVPVENWSGFAKKVIAFDQTRIGITRNVELPVYVGHLAANLRPLFLLTGDTPEVVNDETRIPRRELSHLSGGGKRGIEYWALSTRCV